MEILDFYQINNILCNKFRKKLNVENTYTINCNECDKYEYSLDNGIKIVLFVDSDTDVVNKIKLYINDECLITIKPYRKLVNILCKLVKKLDTTYSLIKDKKNDN